MSGGQGFLGVMERKVAERAAQNKAAQESMIGIAQKVLQDEKATPEAKKRAEIYMNAAQSIDITPEPLMKRAGEKLTQLGKHLGKWDSKKQAKQPQGEAQGAPQGNLPPQAPQGPPRPAAAAAQPGIERPSNVPEPGSEPQKPQRPPNELPGPPLKQGILSKTMHGAVRGLGMIGGAALMTAGGVLQGATRIANGPPPVRPAPMDPAMFERKAPGAAEDEEYKATVNRTHGAVERGEITPEQGQAANAKAAGAPAAGESFAPLPGTKPQLIDGTYQQFFKDKQGHIVMRPLPEGYQPPKGKGLKFDDKTDEVVDQDTGKRYPRDAADAPPEVSAMFKGQKTAEDRKTQNAMKVAYARGESMAGSRVIQVIDPRNPEDVTYMAARDAVKQGAKSPASVAFQIDKSITKAFTSGRQADNLNYFNTAMDHLHLLRQVSDALNNGNMPLFNRLANQWASATGNPAPSNFDTVRAAVSGEISKTFKGTGATNEEIGLINTTINNVQSPDQMGGAIDYYTKLMGGKVNALKSQFESGKKGQPAFPGEAKPSGKVVSLKSAMLLPQNKGKLESEVRKDIESHGHKVVE